MRFKFRAWDGTQMHFASLVDLCAGQKWEFRLSYLDSKAEVMQFTGLTDKTGSPIYEGDIVTARGKDRRDEVLGQIVFSDGEYLVETEQSDWPLASVAVLEHFTVLGNVHQHKELLK